MFDLSRFKRNWKSGALGAALAIALGLFQIPPLGPWFENLSYDLPFLFRAPISPDEAVVIAMDQSSHQVLGQPATDASWDREKTHAKLVQRLTECRARAVVFDILFDQESTNDDIPFLEAIRAATNAGTLVIVGAKVANAEHPDKISGGTTLAPFPALEQIAQWGFAEEGREGAILRRHYSGAEDRGNYVPSLSWRTAELVLTNLTGDPRASRWINYYGPYAGERTLLTRSYADVLAPDRIPATFFSNKVCFVGAHPWDVTFSGPSRADVWATPYSRLRGDARMPGVDIVATVYLNLARHDSLVRMALPLELLFILGAGLLFGWGLTLLRPMMAAGAGLAGMAAVTGTALWLMNGRDIWFSWLIIVLEQVPAAIAWSIVSFARESAREKESLAAQLAAAQTALKDAATSEAATLIDPSTLAEQIKAAQAPTVVSVPLGDGRPVIPDHDLVRRVGKGAYGEVWLARNVIGTYHAVKIVKREDFQSDEPFEREFKGIQKFMPISRSHAGFVQILHAGRNQRFGYIYYIMEMADDEKSGQEINPETYTAKNLAREIKKRGQLPAAECLNLSLDLTAALDYLHQQHLIHRDIKPSNIIFVKGAPKFADIGLVTDIAPSGLETTFLGTFGYIPPEGPGSTSADVFSLGMVLYEASTGQSCQQFPEAASTLRDRSDPAAHPELADIIRKACQKDRTVRYRSALEMREDLLSLQKRMRAVLGP